MSGGNDIENARVSAFVKDWRGVAGGAERANYQLFIGDLCEALGITKPGKGEGGTLGAYQFDAPVPGGSLKGGIGFIDLYKRGCFILEAKQSKLSASDQAHPELFDVAPSAPATPSGAKYDQLMRDARRQAEHYAHSLPGDHPPVPFVIVCDIGRAFELYFDYAGNGRGYGFFPDKQSYRIALDDLVSDRRIAGVGLTARETLRAIWTNPAEIDPRARAADVTRDVAKKLADVSKHLEEEGKRELKRRGATAAADEAALIEGTAMFLMRILFCMFAEDVGLLPRDRFKKFLESCALPYDPDRPDRLIDGDKLKRGLIDLWTKMGAADTDDRWAWAMEESVRYFNGGLFDTETVYPIGRNDLDALIDAARHEWKNVEPAIFGTLLEQALSPADRAKLGAHYTPRPYVERLVQATIMEVLGDEWEEVQDQIRALRSVGDDALALEIALGFLSHVQAQRVLDPACGTGNFLYVAMESLLRLETDVIETVSALGGSAAPSVGPAQFFGLELNPRAAVIAELVLWIGWLRWRTANDPQAVPEPVLRRTDAINFGSHHGYDAVLAQDESGLPDLANPRRPVWPEAEFIVGNPPFIGKGAAMRGALGDDYLRALWGAYPDMPRSSDLVMFWWDRAATELAVADTPLRRFGLVTTNSITGSFNRRVVARHLDGGVGLVFAVPDHPWTKVVPGSAAVRIAMTAAEAQAREGVLVRIVAESGLTTDNPDLVYSSVDGPINSDLTVGSDVTGAIALRANDGISSNGMLLAGAGFVLDRTDADQITRRDGSNAWSVVKPYIGGAELVQAPKGRYVVDFFGLTEKQARNSFPAAYEHVLSAVHPQRIKTAATSSTSDAKDYARRWWEFAKQRVASRNAIGSLQRYIATVETSKHRLFRFVAANVIPDHMVIAIALDDAYFLGVLSSRHHLEWTLRTGGWLGVGNDSRYSKSKVFDPFPFPDPTPEQRTAIGELGEELDATRKAALAEHPRLTMTGLYNLVEKLRAGAALTAAEETDARDARARIVRKLHDDLDAAVATAYGWLADLAPAEIVARLVALNAERAAEEKAGHVRWLRPDYQIPRFAKSGNAG